MISSLNSLLNAPIHNQLLSINFKVKLINFGIKLENKSKLIRQYETFIFFTTFYFFFYKIASFIYIQYLIKISQICYFILQWQ
jgi:hypothetical protein